MCKTEEKTIYSFLYRCAPYFLSQGSNHAHCIWEFRGRIMFYFITHDVHIYNYRLTKLLLRTTMLSNRHGIKHKEIQNIRTRKTWKYFIFIDWKIKSISYVSFSIYSLLFHSFKYKLRTIFHKSFEKTKQKLSRNFINQSCLVRRWIWEIFAFNLTYKWMIVVFFYFYYVVCPQIHIKNANLIRRLKNQYKLDFIEKNCIWIDMTNLFLNFFLLLFTIKSSLL